MFIFTKMRINKYIKENSELLSAAKELNGTLKLQDIVDKKDENALLLMHMFPDKKKYDAFSIDEYLENKIRENNPVFADWIKIIEKNTYIYKDYFEKFQNLKSNFNEKDATIAKISLEILLEMEQKLYKESVLYSNDALSLFIGVVSSTASHFYTKSKRYFYPDILAIMSKFA